MLEKLKSITEEMIVLYNTKPELQKKYLLIKKILNEKDCFLNMSIETAYSILKDLHIPDTEIDEVYKSLI